MFTQMSIAFMAKLDPTVNFPKRFFCMRGDCDEREELAFYRNLHQLKLQTINLRKKSFVLKKRVFFREIIFVLDL